MTLKKGIILELSDDYSEPVRDPIWKNIYLSPGMKQLISTGPMQKLHGIRQLGPTYLVYPGATHTRFSHSLGVFCLARRIIRKLLAFSECIVLDPESVRSFLCAALLHDLGHFPYAHSLKELPLVSHETLTARLIMEDPLKSLLKDRVKADPFTTAAIIDESMDSGGREDIAFFRGILSGVLDPDKLDYLNRDAYFCGVPYGIQDTDFVIDRLRPSGNGIYISTGGLPALENILFSKYLMYRTVYWHRTVRIATAMIKKAVLTAMLENVIQPEDLYGLEDEEFHGRYTPERFGPFRLISDVKMRRLFKSVYEVPFDRDNPLHRDLLSVHRRREFEAEAAGMLSSSGVAVDPSDCIIDVPENISFEIDIPVLNEDDGSPADRVHTPFTDPTVRSFKDSLRYIRIIIPQEAADHIVDPGTLIQW